MKELKFKLKSVDKIPEKIDKILERSRKNPRWSGYWE